MPRAAKPQSFHVRKKSPVPREDVATKARRLLAEGRLTIRVLSEHLIEAAVRGDSALVYTTRWDRGGWTCTCDARSRCSHIRALQLVVLEPVGAAADIVREIATDADRILRTLSS